MFIFLAFPSVWMEQRTTSASTVSFAQKHFQERVNDEVLKIEGVSKMKPVCQLRPWKH
jgi:hypothetical protein